MQALVYDAFGADPRVTELPDPPAPPGGAVVRVTSTGLCRSDWHGWAGHDPDIATFPHTPGHELAGVVEAVGDGVARSWVGRPVTAPFVLACGACATCAAGDGQVCPHQRQPGFTDPGSFAERVVVHAAETNLVDLPAEVPPSVAAGLGCRVATAHRAVTGRGRVAEDETVVVFGCGGVGLAAIQVAAARGARVCGVDLDAGSRALALELGAERVLDGTLAEAELVQAVRDWSGGGAHLSVDAVGSPQTCRTGILSARRRGRHVQVGLLPPAAGRAEVPMERVIGWELDVLGSHGMAAADYPGLLADVVGGRLDLAALVAPGDPVGLEEAGRLLVAMGDSASRGMQLVDPAR
ncbi:zinc-binding dehydrogenase [Phycicoccus sonneratiae]|uniref:Alcohol dehydrogenase catalytic domain-containing protein n=1 Tax=Phycicoccus sonneratiae TaxID=2807628 RepID=A0ABS2CJ52_9MICO|nr:alcohol dehydrogenase catalytic domain-containing protein [Phycicoccus sonneraticus]MBM6399206.1 alcohol dehydrogenase catalytic domain-containing protein [Phycicoccus sonneraticus]